MADEKKDPMEVLDDIPEREKVSIEERRSEDYDADVDLAPA